MSDLTHISSTGEAHMVDVGDKATTQRRAVATRSCENGCRNAKNGDRGQRKKG